MEIQNQKINFGYRIPIPDKLSPEHGDVLQSMVDVDFEEREIVFAPIKNFNLVTIDLEDNALTRLPVVKAYSAAIQQNAANITGQLDFRA